MAGQTTTRTRATGGGSTRAGGGARRARTRALAPASSGFAWLRLIGSIIVVIEHSGPILYPNKITIFPGHWIQTPGYIALMGFFAMSGYQISESWQSDPIAWRFLFKRVLRIFPPLLFVVLVTALVIGPLVTVLPLGEYFGDRDTWGYILNNATLYNIQHLLPGVFVDNPYPWSANGSLWTLAMEFTGYLLVLLLGVVGVLRRARFLLFPVLVALMVGDGFGHSRIGFGGDLGSFLQTPLGATCSFTVAFTVGMIMYAYRAEIPLHGLVALGLLAVYVAVYFTPVARYLMPVMAGYGSIVLAHRWPAGCAKYDRWVYGSYGLYVWAFPLQQLIVLAGVRHEGFVALCAVPAAYLAGLLSWHLIEAPTQQLRKLLPRRPRPAADDPDRTRRTRPAHREGDDGGRTVRREPARTRQAARDGAARAPGDRSRPARPQPRNQQPPDAHPQRPDSQRPESQRPDSQRSQPQRSQPRPDSQRLDSQRLDSQRGGAPGRGGAHAPGRPRHGRPAPNGVPARNGNPAAPNGTPVPQGNPVLRNGHPGAERHRRQPPPPAPAEETNIIPRTGRDAFDGWFQVGGDLRD